MGIAALVTGFPVSSVYGQGLDTIQQKLSSKFTLTEITKDRTAPVTPGTVVDLQHDNLLTYASTCASAPLNTWKSGKLSQSFGSNLMRRSLGGMKVPGGSSDCPQRSFTRGTKLWVIKADAQRDGVVIRIYSDAYEDVHYYGDVKFPFEKGAIPTADEAMARINEVFTIEPDAPAQQTSNAPQAPQAPQGQQGQQQQPMAPVPPPPAPTGSASAPMAPIPPPPPPADGGTTPAKMAPIPPPAGPGGDPATVELGQTMQQVEAALGKPDTVLKVAGAVKYVYSQKGIKVTFKNGKVSDIQ